MTHEAAASQAGRAVDKTIEQKTGREGRAYLRFSCPIVVTPVATCSWGAAGDGGVYGALFSQETTSIAHQTNGGGVLYVWIYLIRLPFLTII